jgi:hypothetical protein
MSLEQLIHAVGINIDPTLQPELYAKLCELLRSKHGRS